MVNKNALKMLLKPASLTPLNSASAKSFLRDTQRFGIIGRIALRGSALTLSFTYSISVLLLINLVQIIITIMI